MIDAGSELATVDYRNEPQKKRLILHCECFFFNLYMLSFHCTEDENFV